MFPLKEAERKASIVQITRLKSAAAQDFIDLYIESMKVFYKEKFMPDEYMQSFREMKEYRNIFLDFIKRISSTNENLGVFVADSFEKIYNSLFDIKTFKKDGFGCNYEEFDIFRLHIWELFVCTTTYLIHIEDYTSINELLVHTYFLRTSPLGSEIKPCSYEKFRFHSKVIEEIIKPNMPGDLCNKYTLAGHYLCNDREYLPIYTGQKIANADLFLYQVYDGLNIEKLTDYCEWFPICYIYADEYDSMWKRLK